MRRYSSALQSFRKTHVVASVLLLATFPVSAQTIVNPSFEADTFLETPGYQGGSNGAVTGWSGPAMFGLNPVDGQNPFADNGTVPDGNQVAFIQGNGSVAQSISNFVVGAEYVVKYWENARSGTTPGLQVTVGGTGFQTTVIVPVHFVQFGQYVEVTSRSFTAVSPIMTLSFVKSSPSAGDHTVLIDHVRLEQISTPPTPVVDSCFASGQLLVADSFDYTPGQNLDSTTAGGIGWAGGYMQEAYDASVYTNFGPLVVSGDTAHGELLSFGNKVLLNDRRSQRNIDLSAIPADLKSESPTNGTVVRALGKSIWLSVVAQQTEVTNSGFFGTSLFRDNVEVIFLGKAGGVGAPWKVEGKFPNNTGLTTNNPAEQSLLVVRIDWNDDGSRTEVFTTNLTTSVVTTNVVPVHPDRAYIWVNPDPNSLTLTPETASANAVSVRLTSQRQDFVYSFNRVGFRGQNSNAGMIDEFRIGTTYRAVVPTSRNQFDLCASRSGTDTVVQWKTTGGAVLQYANSVTSTTWTDVAESYQTNGDRTFVTISNAPGERFYRLLKD